MWKSPPVDGIRSVSGQATGAILASYLVQACASSQSELFSELLCWIFLPVLIRSAKASTRGHVDGAKGSLPSNTNPGARDASSSVSLWFAAIGITLGSIYRAESKTAIVFLPALTPLLLLVRNYLHRNEPDVSTFPRTPEWKLLHGVSDGFWGSALVAAFGVLTLTNWDLRPSVFAGIPVAALLVTYTALAHGNTQGRARFLPLVDIEASITGLASRVVLLLATAIVAETFAFGFPTGGVFSTLTLTLHKTLSWYFTTQTARHASWCVAPLIGVFSIASNRDPMAHVSEFQALSHVALSLVSLAQYVYAVSRRTKITQALWALALIPIVPYLTNVLAMKQAQSRAQSFAADPSLHPVEALSRLAENDFEALLERQSKDYTEAHAEYQRRYKMDPPPGFEAWYDFAVSHDSPIIDDFDSIYRSVSPFWSMSGEKVLEVMENVQKAHGSELWKCSFSGGTRETRCQHPHRTFDRHIQLSFNKLMNKVDGGVLPDIKFVVNHLDEPRVLIPTLQERGGGSGYTFGDGRFRLTNLSGKFAGLEVAKYCSNASTDDGSGDNTSRSVETYGLPFVTDPHFDNDLCLNPAHTVLHGLIARPKTLRIIEGLVPALSTGSPSTMGDILFPSPAYMEDEFQYDEENDVEWEEKRNNVYWAGSTTGGYASDWQWRRYHRQRFVALAQNLESKAYSYLRRTGDTVEAVASSFVNGRLFDAAFTRIFQCERTRCRDEHSFFNRKYWADKDEVFRSRLAFDLDGNGISGRYYKLLASRSTPLKQTIFREWHDDRLVPWVHYVPVSLGMEELPELVTHLTATGAGQARARAIADRGRQWFASALREVDMAIYSYRLLLELSRLQDPGRQAA